MSQRFLSNTDTSHLPSLSIPPTPPRLSPVLLECRHDGLKDGCEALCKLIEHLLIVELVNPNPRVLGNDPAVLISLSHSILVKPPVAHLLEICTHGPGEVEGIDFSTEISLEFPIYKHHFMFILWLGLEIFLQNVVPNTLLRAHPEESVQQALGWIYQFLHFLLNPSVYVPQDLQSSLTVAALFSSSNVHLQHLQERRVDSAAPDTLNDLAIEDVDFTGRKKVTKQVPPLLHSLLSHLLKALKDLLPHTSIGACSCHC
mmetsp:Transcript_27012/g.52655  ORF Transcript_27012/g.52655 Transcript_27012/m.52655 type:complete len:258 (+) Transcript_27012:148-921(+)